MPRPKKGEKGHEEAVKKWRKTMIAKYGSEEELHKYMVEKGRKGGSMSNTGGFAANRELARIAGAKGGKKSRRTGIGNGEGTTKRKPKKSNKNIKFGEELPSGFRLIEEQLEPKMEIIMPDKPQKRFPKRLFRSDNA